MAPADEAVARFVGARNVLPACATRTTRASSAFRRAPRCASRRRSRPARPTWSCRPEDVKLWRAGQAPPGPAHVLSGIVVGLSLQGGFALVRVEVPDALDALIPARDADALGLTLGAAVDVGVPAGAVHVLPVYLTPAGGK